MRALFESWAMRHRLSLLMSDRGEYAADSTEIAWRAWQAAWDNALLTFQARDRDLESLAVYPASVDDRGTYVP